MSPDWGFDDRTSRQTGRAVIGVDEVGRGPLFGPVVAAAVQIPHAARPALAGLGIDDSKRVSPARRTRIFRALLDHAHIGIGAACAGEIDAVGIGVATMLAMKRALRAFADEAGVALIDGRFCPPGLRQPSQAVIGGDRQSMAIASASIIAKVARDRSLGNFARFWPDYSLQQNKGYPTAAHRQALKVFGLTPAHRRSFRCGISA
ncbi:MAG: ribonuclease HII [Pseudomonadota bacterium]